MTVITPCRPATPEEIPATARSLAKLAEANGWDVAITYARHHNDKLRPPRAVDSIAVRMWRETRLAGIWHDGKFASGLAPYRRFDATELRALVRMNRDELRDNLRGIKALEAIIR